MMMTQQQKHCRVLELDKILHRLSACATMPDAAARALEMEPRFSLFEAQHLLKETADAHMLMARFGAPSFGGIQNHNNSLRRAQNGGVLSMGELLGVAEVLRVIRSLSEWRAHNAGVDTALDDYFATLVPNKYMEQRITSCILSEEEMSDNASPELYNIRRKIRNASSRVRDQLDKMIHSAAYQKFLQDPIVTLRGGRYVVPVKAESRGEIPGLVHDTSASGATVFVEPAGVVEANNEIKLLQSKEAAEIDKILTDLSQEAGSFADSIVQGYETCVEINLIFAKARLAYDMKACVPVLNDEGIVELKKARHPLLDPATVVATDIRLGGDFDTLVITGPNTGGKTVTLKTIGLLTLMAMCGLMIPANDGSRIAVFRHVWADIGDEQSIEQSLSTFSAHMTNIIQILQDTDADSLVLLDELGAGTDPVEGAALAAAILETLRQRGAVIAATTHYAELKAYALDTPGVENACCEFDVATLRPTYKLLIGLPGRSNAFAILQRLGMDESVIESAKNLVSSDNARFEDVVDRLQQSHQDLEKERQSAYRARSDAERAAREAKESLARLEREKEKELERARTQARTLVQQARAESERLLGEIEEYKKQLSSENAAEMVRKARAAAKAGMGILEDVADPVRERPKDHYVLPRPLRAGDTVLIVDIDKKGVVLEPPGNSGQVYVQAGVIKTRVAVENLRLIDEKPPAPPPARSRRGVESRALRTADAEIDLRGKMVDEALLELDRFLDSALLGGLETVTIIHGKGTGALRAAVQQHLRTHRSVAEFRRGVYGEGEDGVTIARLK